MLHRYIFGEQNKRLQRPLFGTKINYQCKPDLDPTRDLDVDTVSLFQRFGQDTDKETVDGLLDQELARHIKLCELAILHAANADIFWCDLPKHPIQDFEIWARRHFEKMGFEIEHHYTAAEQAVPSDMDQKKTVQAVVVRSYYSAKWFFAKPLDPAKENAQRKSSTAGTPSRRPFKIHELRIRTGMAANPRPTPRGTRAVSQMDP